MIAKISAAYADNFNKQDAAETAALVASGLRWWSQPEHSPTTFGGAKNVLVPLGLGRRAHTFPILDCTVIAHRGECFLRLGILKVKVRPLIAALDPPIDFASFSDARCFCAELVQFSSVRSNDYAIPLGH
jgi:hypothetical protein